MTILDSIDIWGRTVSKILLEKRLRVCVDLSSINLKKARRLITHVRVFRRIF